MNNNNKYKVPIDVVKAICKINQLISTETNELIKKMNIESKEAEENNGIYKDLFISRHTQHAGQLQGLYSAQFIAKQVLIGEIKFDDIEV